MTPRKDSMTDYTLHSGSHLPLDGKRCAMEWVAYLAGEPHSDNPVCVDHFLTSFCIALNDMAGGDQRQRLRPYLGRTIGTVGDGVDRGPIAWKFLYKEVMQGPALHGCEAATVALLRGGMDFALELLDALLPTVAISPPVVVDAERVCGAVVEAY